MKCYLVSFHLDFHSMCLSLLGPDIKENVTVCDLGAFSEFVSMNENKSVSNFYASYALEEVAYIVGHAPDPYLFIRDFH